MWVSSPFLPRRSWSREIAACCWWCRKLFMAPTFPSRSVMGKRAWRDIDFLDAFDRFCKSWWVHTTYFSYYRFFLPYQFVFLLSSWFIRMLFSFLHLGPSSTSPICLGHTSAASPRHERLMTAFSTATKVGFVGMENILKGQATRMITTINKNDNNNKQRINNNQQQSTLLNNNRNNRQQGTTNDKPPQKLSLKPGGWGPHRLLPAGNGAEHPIATDVVEGQWLVIFRASFINLQMLYKCVKQHWFKFIILYVSILFSLKSELEACFWWCCFWWCSLTFVPSCSNFHGFCPGRRDSLGQPFPVVGFRRRTSATPPDPSARLGLGTAKSTRSSMPRETRWHRQLWTGCKLDLTGCMV